MVHQRKVKTECKIHSKICTYHMNEMKPKTYRYLLKKEGMPSGASPSLDAWVSLNIYLGCLGNPQDWARASPPFLISRPPRSLITSSTQNSTETFSGGVSEYGSQIPSCTAITLVSNYNQNYPLYAITILWPQVKGGSTRFQLYENNETITTQCVKTWQSIKMQMLQILF